MPKWKKCRKKPIVVEFREVQNLTIKDNDNTQKGEWVSTHEGMLFADIEKDFIIRGIQGECYPIKKEIFNKTYEVVENE